MRIPLPKSKLVSLALVALIGSGVAAAALASPAVWSSAPSSLGDHLASIPASFAEHDDGQEDDDRAWDDEHDEDDEHEDEDDD
ncbi:MAG: hypothetical protein ACYC2H_03875 [Thermoplasmatota archaeon]